MQNRLSKRVSIWWGPPKNFDTRQKERRVSWLELFYDLVYVIAIARITEHFSHHISIEGFLEYACLFALIFWGWLNGSFHHDLHGNQGLRTRLMMLWQMMIIAALAVTLDRETKSYRDITVIFMIMQLFITYQWWSVGFYDKPHRKYSWPYTRLFLVSFLLMVVSLWIPHSWFKIIFPVILVLNYMPPFISSRILRRSSQNLNLSSSMFERLGLFTIIIFGELALGVVHGMRNIEVIHFIDWVNFALGFSVVFALWWIFFTFVSNREVRKGFDKASLLELLYIPALISLGCVAVCLLSFFIDNASANGLRQLFGFAVVFFLCCIVLMMYLLAYPAVFDTLKRRMRLSMLLTALLFLLLSFVNFNLSGTVYLVLVLLLLVLEISYLNYIYYSKLLKEGIDPLEVGAAHAENSNTVNE